MLHPDDVRTIRRDVAEEIKLGNRHRSEIYAKQARIYGVHARTIERIISGTTHKKV